LGDLSDDLPAHRYWQRADVVQHRLQGDAQPLHNETNHTRLEHDRVPHLDVPGPHLTDLDPVQQVQLLEVQFPVEPLTGARVLQRLDHHRVARAHHRRVVDARETPGTDHVVHRVRRVPGPNDSVLFQNFFFHYSGQSLHL